MFMVALTGIQIYLSLYYWTYSPVIFVKGVREFDYQLRPYLALINTLAVLVHVACLALYCCVLQNDNTEELQRKLTLLYTVFGLAGFIVAVVLCAVYFNTDYLFVASMCCAALLLFSSILCCDCWRERNETDNKKSAGEVENDEENNVVETLEDRVMSARMTVADLEAENAALEAELRLNMKA